MVTPKDFKAVAEMIAEEYRVYGYPEPRKRFANNLADYFATQNPHFDRSRFMKACGLTE
jgi:hypothetical protein